MTTDTKPSGDNNKAIIDFFSSIEEEQTNMFNASSVLCSYLDYLIFSSTTPIVNHNNKSMYTTLSHSGSR